jgi:molybdopterin molybdotransferase
VSLHDALGLTLAVDVIASISLPPFDVSSVDGYVVRVEDVAGATLSMPVSLRIVGEARPGVLYPDNLESGTAIRIMTGAPIPTGTNAIVPFESTNEIERDRDCDVIQVRDSCQPGSCVRPAGWAIQAGAVGLRRGSILSPARLGTLSSLALSEVDVHRPPRIALLSVGDQYVAPGTELGPAKVYESNEVALAGAVHEAGGVPLPLGIVTDDVDALGDRLTSAPTADLIVLSGGVAHGKYDVVRDFLTRRGRIVFWRVAMRPSRPCGFGWLDRQPIVSLAGNPGAALVGFEQFVRPVIRKMLGRSGVLRPEVDVVVRGHAVNADGRRCFLPARVDFTDGAFVATLQMSYGARATGPGDPNALVIVPEDLGEVRDGQRLRAQMLTWSD